MIKNLVLAGAQNSLIHNLVTEHPIGQRLASRFVAGETLDTAMPVVHALNAQGIAASLDHLGENTTNPSEAAATAQGYIEILDRIVQEKVQANISIKLTALGLDIDEALCLQHVRAVLQQACRYNIFVRLDMEGSEYTERTLRLTHMLHAEFSGKTTEIGGCVGTVIQSMLHRSGDDIKRLVADGIRVRLVKGAYREPSSVAFPHKFDVDENYRQLMHTLLMKGVYPACATHDESIINDVIQFAKEHALSPDRFEFQFLYGIRRDLQERLVKQGYHVRIYIPYGTQWYPYLTRRMAERPANLLFMMSNFFRG